MVVGGRNKYAINGVNVQNNRVQDLFRSVKLNVNNPHFLIMQGRITKVLNMKPPEVSPEESPDSSGESDALLVGWRG